MNARSKPAFLAADAEIPRRLHEYDWRATSLGSLVSWSVSLRAVLHLALATRHPVFIFWGEQHICLYTDACSALIGPEKHPEILGTKASAAWPQTWDLIRPQIEMVHGGRGQPGTKTNLYLSSATAPSRTPIGPTVLARSMIHRIKMMWAARWCCVLKPPLDTALIGQLKPTPRQRNLYEQLCSPNSATIDGRDIPTKT